MAFFEPFEALAFSVNAMTGFFLLLLYEVKINAGNAALRAPEAKTRATRDPQAHLGVPLAPQIGPGWGRHASIKHQCTSP